MSFQLWPTDEVFKHLNGLNFILYFISQLDSMLYPLSKEICLHSSLAISCCQIMDNLAEQPICLNLFSMPGQPHALLQSCLTFGAFSSIIEGFYRKQAALAQPYLARQGSFKGPDDVLPPFTLPFPHQLWEGFSSFCQSLPKSKGIASD